MAVTATAVTTIEGTYDQLSALILARTAGTITLATDFGLSVTDEIVTLAQLAILNNANGAGLLTYNGVTGFETDFFAVDNEATFVDGVAAILSGHAVKIHNDNSLFVAQANALVALPTGVVTATIAQGELATLLGLTGTGNAYTITVADTTAAAADLNTLDGKTTVAVNAASILTLTGTQADVLATYNAYNAGVGSTITGLGDELVTLDVDVQDLVAASAADAVALKTTGVVTATLAADTVAALNTALTDTTVNNYTVTVNDANTITLTALALSTLGGKTDGDVTVTSAVAITGSLDELTDALVTNETKVEVGAATVAVTIDSVDSAERAAIALIDAETTGVITVNGTDAVNTLDFSGYTASHLTINGLAGADIITGGSGNDTINGGDGDDIITGGSGNDEQFGGEGSDRFIITELGNGDAFEDFILGIGQEADVFVFDISSLGLSANDYDAVNGITLITVEQAQALTAGQASNHIIVDTFANLVGFQNQGAWAGKFLAYNTSQFELLLSSDGTKGFPNEEFLGAITSDTVDGNMAVNNFAFIA